MAIKTSMYAIPTDELTVTDIRGFRAAALEAAELMARDRIAAGGEYIARAPQNVADFGCALDQWNTAALAIINTPYTVFQAIAAPAVGARQVIVWYKVSIYTPNVPVSLLTFQEGAAGRTTFAVLDLEQMYSKLQTDAYFSEPVLYPPNAVQLIQVTSTIATLAVCRVVLGGFIIEPVGPQISG